MSRENVMVLNSISKGMSDYLKNKFDEAIIRDMSSEMDDEAGMFHLLVFETIAAEVRKVVDLVVMESITQELIQELFESMANPLREVFEQEWV